MPKKAQFSFSTALHTTERLYSKGFWQITHLTYVQNLKIMWKIPETQYHKQLEQNRLSILL